MKRRTLFLALTFTICFAACQKFEDFQTDPNRTVQATPDLVFSTVQQQAFNQIDLSSALATRQLVNVESVSPQQYYGWLRGSFAPYGYLRQVVKLQQEAERTAQPAYLPVALFFRCWHLYDLTMTFGEVPASEGLMGDEDQFMPAYDDQKAIFLAILNNLDAANSMITADLTPLNGDLVYGGNLQQWKKLINSFSLKVLMTLSSKTEDAELDVVNRFAAITQNPGQYPLMESNSDNAALPFYDIVNNRYPYFNNNSIQTAVYMEKSFVDLLIASQDPRMFRFAKPAPALQHYGNMDFRAYAGANGSASNNENAAQVVSGSISGIHERYYHDPVNEAAVGLGFAEQQLILAEAAVRGWITDDAHQLFIAGVEAALAFSGVDIENASRYLSQPALQTFEPGNEIQEIITQKHIASFMQPGWNAFYEQRRTGFPIFDVSGGAVLNDGRIPKRWMYPESELNTNRENVENAINRQFPEGDNINGLMWLLK